VADADGPSARVWRGIVRAHRRQVAGLHADLRVQREALAMARAEVQLLRATLRARPMAPEPAPIVRVAWEDAAETARVMALQAHVARLEAWGRAVAAALQQAGVPMRSGRVAPDTLLERLRAWRAAP